MKIVKKGRVLLLLFVYLSITFFIQDSSIAALGFSNNQLKQVSVGLNHGAFITSDGSLWTWGDNSKGQLGNGTTIRSDVPIKVAENMKSVSVGLYHTIALDNIGQVWTWGSNDYGQLGRVSLAYGINSTTPGKTHLPQNFLPNWLNNIVSISAGENHCLAVDANGRVYSWGSNSNGQLGYGDTGLGLAVKNNYPVLVKGVHDVGNLSNIKAVSGGKRHSLAITSDGRVFTWGSNYNGTLGSAVKYTNLQLSRYPLLSSINSVQDVQAGSDFNVALKTDGTVWSWGDGTNGLLGNNTNGSNAITDSPVQVKNSSGNGVLNDIVDISAGGASQALALNSAGQLFKWGGHDLIPTSVVYGDKIDFVISISASDNTGIALTSHGVWAWNVQGGFHEIYKGNITKIYPYKEDFYKYDANGRLTEMTTYFEGKTYKTTFVYDANGNLQSVKTITQ